jgi:CheY-like chemotaxis protein
MIGFFVDDNALDRTRISRLLEQDGLEIDPRFEPIEPTALRDALLEQAPDLIALDFRLDVEDLEDNNYKGGALAQILREAVLETPTRDFPIILVSTEENIKKIYSIDRTSHDLFDQKYIKGRLSDKQYRATCHREILSLANGYKAIAIAIADNQADLGALLALNADELEFIPLHGLATDIKDSSLVPHVIARVLLRQMIGRAGPLLAEKDIAAHLGLANEEEQMTQVIDYLGNQNMLYEGIFSDGWPRVWRHRMNDWANNSLSAPLSSFTGEERAEKLSEVMNLELKPALSMWTKKPDELFAFACTVCENPTERRNSVALYDKYLLTYSERKRVCFDCLIRGELERATTFSVDEGDAEIAADVRAKRITRE